MSNDHDEEKPRGFKVEDRRRFSETGEARPEAADPPPPPQASPPPQARQEAPPREAPFEISFSTFIISLSTQALAHLGEIPHPIDQRITVDLTGAKQLIDILGILQSKTAGNLDAAEAALLEQALYDLRLKYVERVRDQRGAAPQ